MMKLSDNTFDVLKNFSTINPSISVKAGNVLRTVSEQKNILAQAVVNESFSMPFAVYDLSQFLGLASLFEDEDYDFGSSSVTISEGKNKSLPSVEVEFDLAFDDLKKVVNAANQLGLPEVVVRGADGAVVLVATDTKNPTSNEFSHDIGVTTDATFDFVFKVENFKFMSDDYKVSISQKGISHFKGSKVEYWVATEAGSKYNA
jgi:hypothetical protein